MATHSRPGSPSGDSPKLKKKKSGRLQHSGSEDNKLMTHRNSSVPSNISNESPRQSGRRANSISAHLGLETHPGAPHNMSPMVKVQRDRSVTPTPLYSTETRTISASDSATKPTPTRYPIHETGPTNIYIPSAKDYKLSPTVTASRVEASPKNSSEYYNTSASTTTSSRSVRAPPPDIPRSINPPSSTTENLRRRRRILFYNRNDPHYGFTNFSPHPVKYKDKVYPTSEHLFQSFKFQDHRPDVAEHIRRYSDLPSVALSEARRFQPEVRPDWQEVNIQKMDETLWHKFTQHPSLRTELLRTNDAELVEDSDKDSFWGIGPHGKGQNELGKALERLRSKLSEEPVKSPGMFSNAFRAFTGRARSNS